MVMKMHANLHSCEFAHVTKQMHLFSRIRGIKNLLHFYGKRKWVTMLT